MRKIFFFIFFSVFLLTLVTAAPPQFSTPEQGLEIRSGVANNIQKNNDYDLHAHVFNFSNGVPIISGIDCFLHIYNIDGTHVFEGIDSAASHNFDYSWDIAAGNFTTLGQFEYIIQCNDSSQGGFYSGNFIVTESGRPEENGIVLVFFMIAGVFTFLLILYTFLNLMADFTKAEVNINTISLCLGAYFINLAYYYYLTVFMPINLMLDISLIGISAFGITHIFLPLVGLIFSWIKNRGVE